MLAMQQPAYQLRPRINGQTFAVKSRPAGKLPEGWIALHAAAAVLNGMSAFIVGGREQEVDYNVFGDSTSFLAHLRRMGRHRC
jgi:hypothetical protein